MLRPQAPLHFVAMCRPSHHVSRLYSLSSECHVLTAPRETGGSAYDDEHHVSWSLVLQYAAKPLIELTGEPGEPRPR